jgi:hypothetical protein
MAPKSAQPLPSCACAGSCEEGGGCACRAAGRKCTKARCTCTHARCSNLWGLKADAAAAPPSPAPAPAPCAVTEELQAFFAACHLSPFAAPLCDRLGLAVVPELAGVSAADLRAVGMKVAEEERYRSAVAAAAPTPQLPPPQPQAAVPASRSQRLRAAAPAEADAGAASALQVHALVIGVSTYACERFPPLTNARSDAVAVDAALRALPGARVTLLENPSLATLRAALLAFTPSHDTAPDTQRGMRVQPGPATPAAAGPPRLGLFFFAGHGLQHAGKNFLIPADFEAPADLELSALQRGSVCLDDVLAATAPHFASLVALDCCRSAPQLAAGGLASVVVAPAAQDGAGAGGTLVAFATAPDAAAEDASTVLPGHSPFTAALLPRLRRGQPLRDIMPGVTDAVRADTSGTQTPWASSCLGAAAGRMTL